jgi:S1-C subfamily serine protease
MELSEKPKISSFSKRLIATVIICLFLGGISGYGISNLAASSQTSDLKKTVANLQSQAASDNSTINSLRSQVTSLQNQVSDLQSMTNASSQISDLQAEVSNLEKQVSELQSASNSSFQNVTYENTTYVLGDNFSLSQLYQQVKSSVVVIEGIIVEYDFFGQPYYAQVQGSGFVLNSTGQPVIITNYHVVDGAINITATFIDGDSYPAKVIGSDPYADLAVLSTNASQEEYKPLEITSSSTLSVGDPVLAVGTPYGLAGTVTTGIVSALGRTITESTSGGYLIADCIQTTTPINPGNSGGPLLTYQGEVVGITTAIVSSSQGLGFAIPSSTILREVGSLITNGSYTNHPWLGVAGTDMDYWIAQATNTTETYGWLITQVTRGGPADKASLRGGTTQTEVDGSYVTIGGDIIIAINGTRITNGDDLSTYLEEKTLPNETINITIVRNNQTMTLAVILGTRPQPSAS